MQRKPALRPKDPINLQRARERLTRNRAPRAMDRLRKVLCDPARLEIVLNSLAEVPVASGL